MASRLQAYRVRRALRVLAMIVGALAIAVAGGYGFFRVFTLTHVEVDGQGMTVAFDQNKIGQNLLFLQTDRIRTELLSEYPLLSDVRFEKKYPGTLVIHLVRREPFVLLDSRGVRYALDKNGVVLSELPAGGSYVLLQFQTPPLAVGGTVRDQNVVASLSFLRALHGVLPISSMTEKDSTSLRAVMGNTDIFLPQNEDLSGKAATLQTIVEGFRIKGRLPSVIDLRFDKPVITNE